MSSRLSVLLGFTAAISLLPLSTLGGENVPKHAPFKIIDRRGKGEAYAEAFAAGGAKLKSVIMLVHGEDPAILRNAEMVMNRVYESGRRHVSLVIGDGDKQAWDVFARGKHVIRVDADSSANGDLGPLGLSAVKTIEEIYDSRDRSQ